MADVHAARRSRSHAVAIGRHVAVVLLRVWPSEAQLEADGGEVRDPYRRLGCDLGAVPVREGSARGG